MICEPTIVTTYYNIRKMENNSLDNVKTDSNYLELANQFILQLPYNLIIFIDDNEEYEYIYSFIIEKRLYKEKTFIYKESFKETFFYKDINKINDLSKKYMIYNRNLNKDTPHYVILNYNKFYFMEKAIEINYFNSTHFLWLDFGINHVAKNPEIIHDWIFKIPNKIKQMCLNPYLENDDYKIFFRYIYHHTSGGLFSGNIENMKKYIQLFKNKVEQLYSDNWYQIDETIMTMIQRENPDLFEFYYGDYQGIISNYLKPVYNLDLILIGLWKTLDFRNYEFTKKILGFLKYYFDDEKNMQNNYYNEYYIEYIKVHKIIYNK